MFATFSIASLVASIGIAIASGGVAAQASAAPRTERAISLDVPAFSTQLTTTTCRCGDGWVMSGVKCGTSQCTNLCIHGGHWGPAC
ncbi:MAG: hypothetical protein ABI175_15505 [Polyangiales bacterium]